jgi:hypothetical protein
MLTRPYVPLWAVTLGVGLWLPKCELGLRVAAFLGR